eukprot:CAMPEP_0202447600 /NCGR_PEP_ID=MMETSP1360-20130828/6370_1 /ASSEMBLY_ACC=CAM_ASM_000848 /TAXON_ID=515479 /ORGANISM="Licmophora paradoxa, Strain CCMP2313" /LENGTH=136 /DNA_ID=CAMNT_0049064773 /DNA_START=67 /DNA_END=477 /DNA_ORIENTATION=-
MTEMKRIRNPNYEKESRALVGSRGEYGILDGTMNSLMKAATVCDKFLSCSYVKKQLEDECIQERKMKESASNRVWNRMDKTLEVELYRQFLFEGSNSLEHSFDEDSITPRTPPRSSAYRNRQQENQMIPGLQRTDS